MKPLRGAVSGIRRRPLRGDQFADAADRAPRAPSILTPCAGFSPALQHFGRGLAFGKREVLLDDQRAAQRHREQHAEQRRRGRRSRAPTST